MISGTGVACYCGLSFDVCWGSEVPTTLTCSSSPSAPRGLLTGGGNLLCGVHTVVCADVEEVCVVS